MFVHLPQETSKTVMHIDIELVLGSYVWIVNYFISVCQRPEG